MADSSGSLVFVRSLGGVGIRRWRNLPGLSSCLVYLDISDFGRNRGAFQEASARDGFVSLPELCGLVRRGSAVISSHAEILYDKEFPSPERHKLSSDAGKRL